MALRYWLVVQPLDRAREQVAGGFVQAPWGVREAVESMGESDGVALYCPRDRNPDGEPLRAFAQAGRVAPGEAYQAGGRGSSPWRRDVDWLPDARLAPVRPLRDLLELTRNRYWGEQLRDGWLELSRRDFIIIEDAVRRPAPEPSALAMGMLRDTGFGSSHGATPDASGPAATDGPGTPGPPRAEPPRILDWPTREPGSGV